MSNHGLFATQRSRAARLEQRSLSPLAGSVVTAPQLTADVNNYGPAGWNSCDVLRISSSSNGRQIHGFEAVQDNRPRLIWNVGSTTISLLNSSSGAVTKNRITAVSEIFLLSNASVVIQYDIASERWRCLSLPMPTPGASGTVLTSTGTTTAPTFQAGGVTGFTSSQNTSSPNNTVNASQLLVSASSTNADIVLSPKGTGAVLAQLPNSATSGGNKRGTSATDLQARRSAADQVASGTYGSILGGYGNTASGTYATSVGGVRNIASGDRSFIGGGGFNTASLNGCVVAGGRGNTATGNYGSILGGRYATTRAIYGASMYANGQFGTKGDAQRGQYILRCLTTDATQTTLTADQGAASTTNQVVLPNNSGYTIRGTAHAHRTDSVGTSVSWEFMANIRRGANAASTTLVGSSVTEVAKDSGGLTWLLDLSADTTNGGLSVKFTGEASKTIRTVCVVESCEVTS